MCCGTFIRFTSNTYCGSVQKLYLSEGTKIDKKFDSKNQRQINVERDLKIHDTILP